MFERNKVDNALQQSAVPAELTLASGEILRGRFLINASRAVYDVLNGAGAFLDFETYEGDRSLIAKSNIVAIRITPAPNVQNLKDRIVDANGFDPYRVLGVNLGSSFDDIRNAYVRLAKIYHPDLSAALTLPSEVREYLAAMSRRVNLAYQTLSAPFQTTKRADTQKAKPIYTSPVR